MEGEGVWDEGFLVSRWQAVNPRQPRSELKIEQ